MSKTVTFEEIHLVLLVPAELPSKRFLAIRRVTQSKAFDLKLSQAIQNVLDSFPEIKEVSFSLNR